jgi:putative ABC transport system ATP-binding protein
MKQGLSNADRSICASGKRVAIARAIVGRPAVILADEPTGALDSANGQAIMKVLAEIAKDPSRGVLVVTHDPRILPFADRIVRIEDGRIVSDEQPHYRDKQLSEHENQIHAFARA